MTQEILVQGACKHDNRWVPRHISGRQDEEDGHATAASERDQQMLLDYPVDLAWSGLACSVRAIPQATEKCSVMHEVCREPVQMMEGIGTSCPDC